VGQVGRHRAELLESFAVHSVDATNDGMLV
jgi:hypothetical protein